MMTIDSLAAEIEHYYHDAIDAEVEWWARFASHKFALWGITTVIKVLVAMHGPAVSSTIGEAQQMIDHLFKPEVAAKIGEIKGICDTPVGDLGGPWATAARYSAYPVSELRR